MEPLASKYRASTLDEFIGQEHLVGSGKAIREFVKNNKIPSMIFWGPPGTGKTTLAYILSKTLNYDFYKLSAVMSGKDNLKKIITKALKAYKENRSSILFLDEIHRWNKSQQDALLPYVEKGVITLIGATTENPSFSLIPALLSRTRVFTFKKHDKNDVLKFIEFILERLKLDNEVIKVDKESKELIAKLSDGDLRNASNILESLITLSGESKKITKETIKNSVENFLQYESRGEDHFNIISAIHKSLRDSDPNAAIYWVTRMLVGGEDPLYIARRLLRFASEDIGNSDPQALILANTVFESCQKLGRPECDIFLIQLCEYLGKAPKSNASYVALSQAQEDVYKYGSLPVPMVIRNAPTKLMKDLGYGKGYKYAPEYKDKKLDQQHFPDELKDRKYLN